MAFTTVLTEATATQNENEVSSRKSLIRCVRTVRCFENQLLSIVKYIYFWTECCFSHHSDDNIPADSECSLGQLHLLMAGTGPFPKIHPFWWVQAFLRQS